jgi:hypothetical protein
MDKWFFHYIEFWKDYFYRLGKGAADNVWDICDRERAFNLQNVLLLCKKGDTGKVDGFSWGNLY